jgi:uncharacterized protein (UPF0276 family)
MRAGIGLKPVHYQDILDQKPDIGWFEAHPENYMGAGGPPHAWLTAIREHYPLSLHGVGLSLGGSARPDKAHLARLKQLIERYQPESFSEHLAWSSHQDQFYNDLLALPLTAETLELVCDHIDEVQEVLGVRMLLENPSTYVVFSESEIEETAFLAEVAQRTGCGLLLDVNNVFVSCSNQGRDPSSYLKSFAHQLVGEIHLAGHTVEHLENGEVLRIDTHDQDICDEVFALYGQALALAGPVPTLIERDGNIPPLEQLLGEAALAEHVLQQAVRRSQETKGEGIYAHAG